MEEYGLDVQILLFLLFLRNKLVSRPDMALSSVQETYPVAVGMSVIVTVIMVIVFVNICQRRVLIVLFMTSVRVSVASMRVTMATSCMGVTVGLTRDGKDHRSNGIDSQSTGSNNNKVKTRGFIRGGASNRFDHLGNSFERRVQA